MASQPRDDEAAAGKRGRDEGAAPASSALQRRRAADPRFRRASGRALAVDPAAPPDASFVFVQLADTQLGMLTENGDFAEEVAMTRAAVDAVNAMEPRPKFVAVCGDLVHAFPTGDDARARRRQVEAIQDELARVHSDIALVCVCGNHDIGNRPNAATIDMWRADFGDDYYAFAVGGCRFLVLNSSLWKDASDAADLAAAHDAWLDTQLADGEQPLTVVFSHIPPFVDAPGEADDYFNLATPVRQRVLARLKRGGVRAWFCGHFHRNAGGWDEGLEVVVSSAVGVQLISPPGAPRLGLPVVAAPRPLGRDVSGLRVVKVLRRLGAPVQLSHRWFTLDRVPQSVDLGTAEWPH